MQGGSFHPHTIKQFSGYQLGILQFNPILTLSTQRQHQIPQVKGSVLQDRTSPPLQMPVTSPDCHLCFYRLEVPTTPSLGSINLLEWLTELRETFYLLNYQFIVKGYNSGTARWKRYIRGGMGKGQGSSMLPESLKLQTLGVL